MNDFESFNIAFQNAFGFAGSIAAEQWGSIGYEWSRPSRTLRPQLMKDGNAWIALYGENLQVGLVGCGSSPAKAMDDFDKAYWREEPSK